MIESYLLWFLCLVDLVSPVEILRIGKTIGRAVFDIIPLLARFDIPCGKLWDREDRSKVKYRKNKLGNDNYKTEKIHPRVEL